MFKIGIIGIGFIGGSLVKSLYKSDKVESIVAFDKDEESLKSALRDGTITDYTMDIDEKFSVCDIIFICTPVSCIADYARKLEKVVKKDCIITDIGSTKGTILNAVKDLSIEYIGSHPMIGSERSGYATSKEFLFENSYFIITRTEKNSEQSITRFVEVIDELKAIPIVVGIEEHDYIVSVISHVPHVIAAILVNMVKYLDDNNHTMKTLAAGGFKDITRIASSDPTMWSDICKENMSEIRKNLKYFSSMLTDFIDNMYDSEKVYSFFESSKCYRDSFVNVKVNGVSMPELDINIKDESGAIAKIATILGDNGISIKNIEVVNNRENNYGALKVVFESYQDRDSAFGLLIDGGYDVKEIG